MHAIMTFLLSGPLFICFAAAAFAANSQTDPAQPTVPEGTIEISGAKKKVAFSHEKGHKDIECVVCHHKVDGKPTFAKCADAGCHDDLKARKGVNSLYFVMHSRSEELKHQSCVACHAKVAAEKPDLKKSLTGCHESWCHPEARKRAPKSGEAQD